MFVARLSFNDAALGKLARRGIAPGEVRQLLRNRPVGTRNPHPRVKGSRMLIGPTDGGRFLTVVVEPDEVDEGIWHVRTAWDTSPRERSAYHQGN